MTIVLPVPWFEYFKDFEELGTWISRIQSKPRTLSYLNSGSIVPFSFPPFPLG